MDKDVHRRWHESFLPSTRTDSGEPRLLCSYRSVFNGFAARLTDAELEALAKKPVARVPGSHASLPSGTPVAPGREAPQVPEEGGWGGAKISLAADDVMMHDYCKLICCVANK